MPLGKHQALKQWYLKIKKITPEQRPYWFSDAKWTCAILATVLFTGALITFNVSQVISKDNVVDSVSTKIDNGVNTQIQNVTAVTKGLMAITTRELEIKMLIDAQTQLQNKASQSWQSAEDIRSGEFGSSFFQSHTLNKYIHQGQSYLYSQAALAVGSQIDQLKLPGSSDTILKSQKPFQIQISKAYSPDLYFHYKNIFVLLLIFAIIFMIAAFYFSSGFGRLMTLGFIFFFSSLPGYGILRRINSIFDNSFISTFSDSNNGIVKAFFTPIYDTVNTQIHDLINFHLIFFIIGMILIVLGIIGKIWYQHLNPGPR